MKFRDYLASLPLDEQKDINERADELMLALAFQVLMKCGRPSVPYLQRRMEWPRLKAKHWVEKVCESVPTKQWDEDELPWFDFEKITKMLLAHTSRKDVIEECAKAVEAKVAEHGAAFPGEGHKLARLQFNLDGTVFAAAIRALSVERLSGESGR